jgi:energy-coupling factor transport system permease protein
MRHPLSWLIWAGCAAVLALMARHPLYLTLVVLATWLVYLGVARSSLMVASWRALLKLGLFIWLITIPFNALMIHQGRVVLFRLPAHWPLIGGPITLEAVLAGATAGYALWALLFIFAAFNLGVDAAQLLRLAPPFLYQAGVVTSIALTFIPQMLASAREIREAQRIRGHRFRGWRDSLPLVIPLLTTAFERAVQLAESMDARGFGGALTGMTPRYLARLRGMMVLSLLLFLIGMVAQIFWPHLAALAYLLIALAAAMLLYAFHRLGRSVRRSRYRRERWGAGDSAIALCSLAALAGALWLRYSNPAHMTYAPYTGGLLPAFHAPLGLLLTLLAVPGLIALAEPTPEGDALQDVAP